jgi:hypothetical protein
MSLAFSQASILEFHTSSFTIHSECLLSLQPGKWLNDEIIIGTLRLLKEVSNNKVQVVDSLAEKATRIDFHKSKVLLPMLISGNHWVLGVYEDRTLLVYDSFPTSTTKSTILNKAYSLLPDIFKKDDKSDPKVTITSPLLQINNGDDYDCGVFSIIAAFHETMDFGIKPMEIDPDFWRDILLRLLSPQPYSEHLPVETQIDLPSLPANARSSELPAICSRFFQTISANLHEHSNDNKRKLSSAELVLKITRHAKEGATKAGLTDAIARFQHVEAYCDMEVRRLRQELELERWIDSLPRVRITN